jgi:hypothetical protein
MDLLTEKIRRMTPEKALKGIRNLVADVLLDKGNTGEPVPEPIAIKQ